MKVPKKIKRYCPKCRKVTEMSINIIHKGKRSEMMHGQRRRKRALQGHGDKGHYSKPPIKDWSRNSKVTPVKDAYLECTTCKKKMNIKGGFKAKKFEITK